MRSLSIYTKYLIIVYTHQISVRVQVCDLTFRERAGQTGFWGTGGGGGGHKKYMNKQIP